MRTAITTLLAAAICIVTAPAAAQPSRLDGGPGEWRLLVDGQPFELRGVGCARHLGRLNSDYLTMAAKLGANAVRTWGARNTGRDYLDAAQQRGLQVNAGLWLPYAKRRAGGGLHFDYRDAAARAELREKTLDYVRRFREHPAILLWTVGNEVIHHSPDAAQRRAFTAFLQELVAAIRHIDPEHPIGYAAAGWKHLGYLQAVPGLDFIGVNAYGNLLKVRAEMQRLGDSRPLLFTELGPLRQSDQARDRFGQPQAPADEIKSRDYRRRLAELEELGGHALGAFVFRLGDPKPDDLHWWNLSLGERPRDAFFAVRELYTGKLAENSPPRCHSLEIREAQLAAGQPLKFTIDARDPEGDDLHYTASLWPLGERDASRAVDLLNPQLNGGSAAIEMPTPERPGDYLLLTTVIDRSGNVCLGRGTIRLVDR